LLGVAFGLVVAGLGCSFTAPSQTRFMRKADIDVSAEELRIRVRGLAGPFSGIMEEAADDYLEVSTDPEGRRRALLFKINGIPAMQTALFDQDPLAALLDAWVLVAQMRLFITDAANETTPESRTHMKRAVDRMEEQIEELATSISVDGDISEIRDRVYAAAEETPIDVSFVTRRSTATEIADFTAETSPGLRSAVGQLSFGLGDVWARMDVYAAYVPKQARWQAELVAADLFGGRDPGTTIDDFSRLTDSIDRIADTVEQAPGLVESERREILDALTHERIAVLEAIHRELLGMYSFVDQQRRTTFENEIVAQREAILTMLTKERIAIVEAIGAERRAMVEEMDDVVGGLAEDAMLRVVDRLFLRLLQLLAVAAVLAAAGIFLFMRVFRKP
jgi:hypothetical protein